MLRGRFRWLFSLSAMLAMPVSGTALAAANDGLQIIAVDVDGGGGTLFITPEGKSVLIDAAWPDKSRGTGAKDSADRFVDTAHAFGLTKIDYFIMTHYHIDHAGGFASLFAKIPIGTFIDHGPNREFASAAPPRGPGAGAPPANLAPANPAPAGPPRQSTQQLYEGYMALIKGHPHIIAQVGQKLDVGSLHILFVTSDGNTIAMGKVPGAGGADPYCDHFVPMDRDGGIENAMSVGMLFTYGKTRIVALGDLNWNREKDLFCPNHIGPVDVEIGAGHSQDLSGSPAAVNGLRAQVVIVANGQTKGGDASVLKTYTAEPRLQGLWKLHTSVRHHETDGDLNMIANIDDDLAKDKAYNLRIRVTQSGQITVINERNGFNKTYTAKGLKD